jgi:ThiF family
MTNALPLVSLSSAGAAEQPGTRPIRFRITRALFEQIQADLVRPHPTAFERVGFLSVATGAGEAGETLILGSDYVAVKDEHYLDGRGAGARISVEAIREALQSILDNRRGLFHVHMHAHLGTPDFSPIDRSEQPKLVASFRAIDRHRPHGMLLLSRDQANAWVWLPGETKGALPEVISIVGYPTQFVSPSQDLFEDTSVPTLAENQPTSDHASSRYDRQSFLGPSSQKLIERARVAVVGLGGGGSHVVQQLAHVGFRRFRLFDGDIVQETNLNRLVGAVSTDVEAKTRKTTVAKRVIDGLLPGAEVVTYSGRWQDEPARVRGADIVVACVDSFAARHELEVICRRYLIPLVDIGMDINQVADEPPRMVGQVILSSPDSLCFWCMGFLSQDRLALEAAKYGAAGDRPQVVWPNGVLASTAVGIVIDLVTGWSRQRNRTVYMSYDGNLGSVSPHVRLKYLDTTSCRHFSPLAVGDPVLRSIA